MIDRREPGERRQVMIVSSTACVAGSYLCAVPVLPPHLKPGDVDVLRGAAVLAGVLVEHARPASSRISSAVFADITRRGSRLRPRTARVPSRVDHLVDDARLRGRCRRCRSPRARPRSAAASPSGRSRTRSCASSMSRHFAPSRSMPVCSPGSSMPVLRAEAEPLEAGVQLVAPSRSAIFAAPMFDDRLMMPPTVRYASNSTSWIGLTCRRRAAAADLEARCRASTTPSSSAAATREHLHHRAGLERVGDRRLRAPCGLAGVRDRTSGSSPSRARGRSRRRARPTTPLFALFAVDRVGERGLGDRLDAAIERELHGRARLARRRRRRRASCGRARRAARRPRRACRRAASFIASSMPSRPLPSMSARPITGPRDARAGIPAPRLASRPRCRAASRRAPPSRRPARRGARATRTL